MTYGYPPPPRDWRPSEPDDESSSGWSRQEPSREQPPTTGRRKPQPPPPAKHVPPSGGLHSRPQSPTPYPQSPQPYGSPSSQVYGSPTGYPTRPTSPPPSMRRPPPNNAGGGPPAYPAFPPPVPTSPTPRIPPPPASRMAPPPAGPPRLTPRPGPSTGGQRTGGANTPTGPRTGSFGAPKGGGGPMGAGPRTTNFMPPSAPNRKPGARPPVRPPVRLPRGVSFRDVQGLIKQLPQHKPWMVALGAIAIMVVVSVCGLGSWLVFTDDEELVGAAPTPQSTVVKRDITSREVDPNPLTAADAFPTAEIVVDPNFPYRRQGEVQVAEDCRVGATGEVGKLLQTAGCNQVIRATFATSDNAYIATGGIFNLTDAAGAAQVATDVKALITGNQGRFTGYISDPAANVVLGRAPTNLAWEVRGHFIVYIVIAKADGTFIDADDGIVKVIIYDILQKYLRDHVIDEWAIVDTPPSGAASPSH